MFLIFFFSQEGIFLLAARLLRFIIADLYFSHSCLVSLSLS